MSTTAENNGEFVVTHILNAPRELVFKAWTEAERLRHWWEPAGFVLSVLTLELQPGGVFHYGMRSADGHAMWGKFTYREITPPERIVSVLSFADQEGNPVRHPMSPTWPLLTLNELALLEEDGKTVMTLRSVPLDASDLERETFKQGHASMDMGFGATFGQLEAYLDTIRP